MKIFNLIISILALKTILRFYYLIRRLKRIETVFTTLIFCLLISITINSQSSLCSQYGTIPGNAIYFNSKTISSPETYTDKYIVVNGDLTINHILATFTRCTFNISSGSQIFINSGKRLSLFGCLIFSCGDTPWNGVYVSPNGLLICRNASQNNTIIENANNAIILLSKSKLTLESTIFTRNDICIYVFGSPTIFKFKDNIFSGVFSTSLSNIGINLDWYNNTSLPIYSTFDVEGIASGINQFIGLKYGIHGLNSTIKIQNCQFSRCENGISNSYLKGKVNNIKGFGKESTTATFINNNAYNIYIEGDSYTRITDCKFFIDTRFNASVGIPNVTVARNKNNGGSTLIENNSFIDELYSSTYADVGMSNTDLYIYFCPSPGGFKIANNSFKATNHSLFTKHLIVQCYVTLCDFISAGIISDNNFELNSIYCVDVGISEEEPEYSNGEFNFCLSCTQSRSLFIDLCYNTLISDNNFTKDATGATSTEINGGSQNVKCIGNTFNETNRLPYCDNVGLRIVGSSPEVCNNYFLENFVGLDALYQSTGTRISSNTFDGNYTGIHYFNMATIGGQFHRGNKWENVFESGYKLIHDNGNPSITLLNQYKIDPNNYGTLQHFWPGTFAPSEFVFPEQSVLQACSSNPFDPYGPEIFINLPYGPRWESYYFTIRYMEQGGNFEDLGFETLYDSLYNLPIFKLMQVEKDISELYSQLSIYNDSLLEFDLIMEDVTIEIDEQKLNVIDDSIETGFSLDSLYYVLDSLYLMKESIYIRLLEERNEILEQIYSQNNSITTSSDLEINRINLNNIKIKLLKNELLSFNDSTFLRSVSVICGLNEGNNDVIARSILRSYFNVDLLPSLECVEESLIDNKSDFNNIFNKLDELIHPKKVNGDISLKSIEIFDLLYRKVNIYKSYEELTNALLIPGLYILRYNLKNGELKTTKLWLPIN